MKAGCGTSPPTRTSPFRGTQGREVGARGGRGGRPRTHRGFGAAALGLISSGEGEHAGQVEGIQRLAGLLHGPTLGLVALLYLLRGRGRGGWHRGTSGTPMSAPQPPQEPPPIAHLDGQVVAGRAVVVLVQHFGDIAGVKLVARQAGRPPLGTQRGQRRCPPPSPKPTQRGGGGSRGRFWGQTHKSHPVLHRLAVVRPLRPLPAVGLHQVDAELDERPRGVLLVRGGKRPHKRRGGGDAGGTGGYFGVPTG